MTGNQITEFFSKINVYNFRQCRHRVCHAEDILLRRTGYGFVGQKRIHGSIAAGWLSEKSEIRFTGRRWHGVRSVVGRCRHGEPLQFPDFFQVYNLLFFFTWNQTTYSTCFLLYHIARNPEVQEKLFAEAMAVIPNYETDEITAEKMNHQLSYSKAVLKESFRLNPVSVGVGRTTNTDLVLNGYNVPKGVSEIPCNRNAKSLK